MMVTIYIGKQYKWDGAKKPQRKFIIITNFFVTYPVVADLSLIRTPKKKIY